MYSSIHWMKEMRAAHNATRPRQVARAPQRRRSARKAPCRGGAPPLPTVPRTRPPTVPLLGHRRRRGRRRRTRGVSHVGGSQSVGFLLGLDRLPGVGPPSSSRRPGPRRPYCCSYPCPYCTLPPSLPTVAPTRVPTVHSLPPSLAGTTLTAATGKLLDNRKVILPNRSLILSRRRPAVSSSSLSSLRCQRMKRTRG